MMKAGIRKLQAIKIPAFAVVIVWGISGFMWIRAGWLVEAWKLGRDYRRKVEL